MQLPRARMLMGVVVGTAIAVTLVAAPASAATQTRWVDDDGHAGAAGCKAGAAAYKRVQKAVIASGANDVVKVCPGIYSERVIIPSGKRGLVLRGVVPGKAVITLPGSVSGTTLTIGSNDVIVRDLTVRARTVGAGDCQQTSLGVLVDGTSNTLLTGLTVLADPAGDTKDYTCGLFDGIKVQAGAQATISKSLVRDFLKYGIEITDSGSFLLLQDSDVEWIHGFTPIASASATVPAGDVSPAGDPSIVGVVAHAGAGMTVRGSTFRGAPGSTSPDDQLFSGIAAWDTGAKIRVRHNVLRRSYYAMFLFTAPKMIVRDNVVTDGGAIGVYLGNASDATLSGNEITRQGSDGVFIQNGGGHSITDNDFRGNGGVDCHDVTTGGGTAGTADTWTGNLGDDDDPDGLCSSS